MPIKNQIQMSIKVLALLLSFMLSVPKPSVSQVFPFPQVKAQTAHDVSILNVEVTDKNTILTLSVVSPSIYISSKTYIVPSEGGDPMYIQKVNGMELNKIRTDLHIKPKKYELYFPKIDSKVKSINFRSGEDGNYWHFFEINLFTSIGVDLGVKSGQKGKIKGGKYINNPGYTAKSGSFDITRIDLLDTATVLHFHVNMGNSWIFIPKKSSIRNSKGGKDLFLRSATGASIGKKIIGEEVGKNKINYKLFFPPLSKSVRRIDFRELNEGGNWAVYELDVDVEGVD